MAINEARESTRLIRRESVWFHWKSAFWTVLVGFTLLSGILIGLTYYLDYGYQRIADMQAMKKQWEKKAPLANIGTCDNKPCVEVTGNEYANKK